MEAGLVIWATAFISIAAILWVVVAKLASNSEATATSSTQLDEVEVNTDDHMTSTQHAVVTTSTSSEKKRMSRRQRKNVKKREKDSGSLNNLVNTTSIPSTTNTTSSNTNNLTSTSVSVFTSKELLTCSSQTTTSNCKDNNSTSNPPKVQRKRNGLPSRLYVSINLSDERIYIHLHNYILDQNTLRTLGFPLESQLSPGKAWVYQDPEFRGCGFVYDDEPTTTSNKSTSTSSLDVNAREFVPKRIVEDEAAASGDDVASTHSGSSLSASAKEFVPGLSCSSASASPPSPSTHLDQDSNIYENRSCARCNKIYSVFKDTGECVQPEACVYHWGKPRSSSRKYSCCGRRMKTNFSGCETASSHVWRGILYEISGQHKDLEGFTKTRTQRNRNQSDGNHGVYGIDGEMLFTTQGMQLCKITVVGIDGKLVYETLVQPEDPIVDYNTRFSGVSAKDLKRGPTKSLKEVQNDLLGFISANSILMGHSLENDLRALKLVHMTVIDTSLVFPHYYGMPFRRSLKSIVHSYLNREIQEENCGHDSYEDARACIELMLWKVRQDLQQQQQQPPQHQQQQQLWRENSNYRASGRPHQYSPFPPPQLQQPPEQ